MSSGDLASEAFGLERAGRGEPLAWRIAAGAGGDATALLAVVTRAGDRLLARRAAGGEAVLFEVDGGRPVEIGRRYEVRAGVESVAVIEHRFRASLVRANWALLHGREGYMVAWAREDAMGAALGRRIVGWAAPGRLPMPLGFTVLIGQREVGRLARLPGREDRYRLDLGGDPGREIDRRAALGLALLVASGR